MTRDIEQNILGIIGVIALAFTLGFVIVHAARGEPLVLDHAKFYVTVTLGDKNTNQEYEKLVFNPAGAFDTKEACIEWISKKDPKFLAAGVKLMEQAREQFGPSVGVYLDCEQPPESGEHV